MAADSAAPGDRRPFDALLFLSFGGPERVEDIRPFLENVTRGRGVPPERLDDVAEHYVHFGGSPLNGLNREMIDALRAELDRRGRDLPIYFGNRNWNPLIDEAVDGLLADGHRRALVFATSAWGGYSGCKQYHEDIARAVEHAGEPDLLLRRLPQFCTEPGFLDASARAVRAGLERFDGADPVRVVFTAHSIPIAADERVGDRLYSRQVAAAAAATAERLGLGDFDLVWQSRSGPPQVPWLEPDIGDHLRDLAAAGVQRVLVAPIGFISDHIEVVWDLDEEARELAAELGLDYVRAATVGTDPGFIAMIADLVERYADGGGELTAPGVGDNGNSCGDGC